MRPGFGIPGQTLRLGHLLARLKKALAQRPAPKASAQCTETRLLEMGHKALEGYDARAPSPTSPRPRAPTPPAPWPTSAWPWPASTRRTWPSTWSHEHGGQSHGRTGDMAGPRASTRSCGSTTPRRPTPSPRPPQALGSKGDHATARALLSAPWPWSRQLRALPGPGDTLLRLGDREGARHQVTAALKLKDDFPEARKLFKALTGQRWTESESSQAHARRQEEEEEKRSTVRFWVPDLLVAIKGHDEHFTLSEMSLRSLAFSPMGHTFAVEEELRLDILKLTEDGTRPRSKRLKRRGGAQWPRTPWACASWTRPPSRSRSSRPSSPPPRSVRRRQFPRGKEGSDQLRHRHAVHVAPGSRRTCGRGSPGP